jgi:hypothetical protein
MPVIREPLSISQFAELVGVEPSRLVGVEFSRRNSSVTLVLEPLDVRKEAIQDAGACQADAPAVAETRT